MSKNRHKINRTIKISTCDLQSSFLSTRTKTPQLKLSVIKHVSRTHRFWGWRYLIRCHPIKPVPRNAGDSDFNIVSALMCPKLCSARPTTREQWIHPFLQWSLGGWAWLSYWHIVVNVQLVIENVVSNILTMLMVTDANHTCSEHWEPWGTG